MLVDEQFRKSVAFLYVDRLNASTGLLERQAVATSVLVGVDIGDDRKVPYAVTNVHVVNNIRPLGTAYLRINAVGRGYRDLLISPDAWILHDSTDVAVGRVPAVENWDHLLIPDSMLASDSYVRAHRVGIGDEVFFVGLFSQHAGLERMQPIIRFGQISMMPHEKVKVSLDPVSDPTPVDAYLVEARSWGGHSGSPVFVHYPPDREGGGNLRLGVPEPALLGIVSGHFDIDRPVKLIADVPLTGNVGVNAGIAIVIPAQAILDTLHREDVVNDRTDVIRRAASSGPSVSTDGAPTTE